MNDPLLLIDWGAQVEVKQDGAGSQAEATLKQMKKQQPSVTKTNRKEIQHLLFEATRKFRDNLPWVVKQLDKRMEDVVSDAKIEIEAYATNRLRTLGVEALAAGAAFTPKGLDSGAAVTENLLTAKNEPKPKK